MNSSIQSYLDAIEDWLKKWRLSMATNKCNYIVFSSNKKNQEHEYIDIKLFENKITPNKNPVFLGIRFDNHLSFKNQIEYMTAACIKRLNVLKVLANKKWGLSIKTLTSIYKSLIRSLLEYSSIIYPCFSISNLELLEKIQFRCLKIIHGKSKYESNDTIRVSQGYEQLEKRFDSLNINYIKKSMINKNPIIEDLYEGYLQYSKSRILKRTTLLCKYKNCVRS